MVINSKQGWRNSSKLDSSIMQEEEGLILSPTLPCHRRAVVSGIRGNGFVVGVISQLELEPLPRKILIQTFSVCRPNHASRKAPLCCRVVHIFQLILLLPNPSPINTQTLRALFEKVDPPTTCECISQAAKVVLRL